MFASSAIKKSSLEGKYEQRSKGWQAHLKIKFSPHVTLTWPAHGCVTPGSPAKPSVDGVLIYKTKTRPGKCRDGSKIGGRRSGKFP
ncbi:MAG TPA: hypothetical protein VN673_00200, partial [Clostridia bacterium]|nr:hypothetical protein [Clostridia bacterium]